MRELVRLAFDPKARTLRATFAHAFPSEVWTMQSDGELFVWNDPPETGKAFHIVANNPVAMAHALQDAYHVPVTIL